MASSPELFVVCKNCRSQVSPYITECPYCGQRLRKRAPKIERGGEAARPKKRRAAPKRPSLGPLRTGEIPGIRGDEFAKPRVTIALVAIAALWWLATIPLRDEGVRLVVDPLGEWWQVLTAPFINANGWYQFAALGRDRHLRLDARAPARPGAGPARVAAARPRAAWRSSSSPTSALQPISGAPYAVGASGGALGLLCAWAVPVLLARRRRGDMDDDADMIGAGVIFVLLALMPAARDEISVIATVAGIVIGVALRARARPPAPRRLARLSFAQRAVLGVEHEPADVVAGGELGALAQPDEAVAERVLDVVERAQAPGRQHAVGRQRLGELVLGRAAQAAAVVHDDDDLLGAEQALGRG